MNKLCQHQRIDTVTWQWQEFPANDAEYEDDDNRWAKGD